MICGALSFALPKLAQTIKPGQFESFYVPGDPSQIVRIPLSFSAVDKREGTLETIYAVVGDGTRASFLI